VATNSITYVNSNKYSLYFSSIKRSYGKR